MLATKLLHSKGGCKMKKVILFVALILIVSVIIGCASQSTSPAGTTSSAPPTSSMPAITSAPPQTSAPTPTIKTGGIMKVLIAKPAIAFGYPPKIVGVDGDYTTPFWNRLVRFDEGSIINPELATSWEWAPDGKSLTFHLRQGVKFHDGTDFDAEAVKFNLDLVIPPNGVQLSGIDSVSVIDKYTVKLNTPQFSNVRLYQLAVNYAGFMASPTAIKEHGAEWARLHPVGTGPFTLKDFVSETSMSMVPNPNYWDKGLPYLDGIEITTVTDAMTQMTMFQSGSVNVMYDVKPPAAAQLRDQGYNVLFAPGSVYFLSFDTKSPDSPFAKPKVREALEYAIDKEAICSGPGMDLYTPIYQVVRTNSPAYSKESPVREYNPAKAKQLLAEAGYADGFEFTGTFQNTTWIDGITAVQKYLADVGIKMDMDIVTNAAMSTIRNGQDQLKPGTACQITLGNYTYENYYFTQQWRSNYPQYKWIEKPAGIDDLINQAEAARTDTEAYKICQKIVKMLYDDATVLPLWLNPRIVVTDKKIQDCGYFINGEANNNKLGWTSWLKE